MAYSVMPKPGTKLGPCAKECKHIDCAQNRAVVAERCQCGEPIGYETAYCVMDDKTWHYGCAEEFANNQRAV